MAAARSIERGHLRDENANSYLCLATYYYYYQRDIRRNR